MAPTLCSDPMIITKYVIISIMSYRHVARPPVKESCLEFANLKLANRKISYIIYMQHCCHIKEYNFIGIQIFQNRYIFFGIIIKYYLFCFKNAPKQCFSGQSRSNSIEVQAQNISSWHSFKQMCVYKSLLQFRGQNSVFCCLLTKYNVVIVSVKKYIRKQKVQK